MRVVIDTNILVSAVIRDRLPGRVLLWCLRRADIDWLVTQAIMDEYPDRLGTRFCGGGYPRIAGAELMF